MFKVLLCVEMAHDWRLVAVAAVVCVVATLATFYLYAKTPPNAGWRRLAWLGMSGLVSGSGIWTTHFVAMLAFETGLPTGYAAGPTAGSLGVAILSTTTGLSLASSAMAKRLRVILGGLVVGLGITLMHYVGMSGYRVAGHLAWNPAYVVGSVIVGAGLATAALLVAAPGATARRQRIAAGLLTLGIVGMHFTGMTAVTITPDGRVPVSPSALSDAALAGIAVAVTCLILMTAMAGVALDAATRYGSIRRLREALDAMPEGIAFFDGDDRLVAWNARYGTLCESRGSTAAVGVSFRELLLKGLTAKAFPDALGREDAWMAERLAARSAQGDGLVQRTPGGRWMRVSERPTADGGAVSITVDITELKAAEEAMAAARDEAEESARRAETAEAIAGLGHWRMDARTDAITWSDQLYRIYGFETGAPLDLPGVMAMTHPEDVAALDARLTRQRQAAGPDETQLIRIFRADGETRYLSSNSRSELDAAGEVTAVIGTVVDITERRLAEIAVEQSEERFRRLAMNAPDMIAESRLDGTMTYVSPACMQITGFDAEELVGRPFTALMDPEDGAQVLAMCQTVFASKGEVAPWPVEFRARHKDGHEIWLECKPTLARDTATGRFAGLTDVIRDITPRKALEADLRAAQAAAEQAAAVKGEFLANMSHELRTPLTSIIGFTSLASEQGELSDLSRNYIERVGNASRALLCTVNDILDFSKLEAGQVSILPQPTRLAKLTRATLDLFTPQAGAKDLTLVLDDALAGDDLVLAIDPDRIRQILLNFVSNAVKFTDAGSVTLRTAYSARDKVLRVEVIDTGAGIPAEKQGALFKRFSQVDGSLTRAHGGTGLGLAICKGLVEAMGGEIGAESAPGRGSRFWFRIPTERAAMEDAADEGGGLARPSFDGVRVLVVDDHATNRELARLFLSGVGGEVTEAADGETAVEMAADWPFDVILMDLRMPGLDGRGALKRIRAAEGPNDKTPILAFSADLTPDLIARLTRQGFAGVVAKPIEPEALIQAVAKASAFIATQDDKDEAHAAEI